MSRLKAQIVGRDDELETLKTFAAESPRAFMLSGGPGIGKTTLWEAGITAARERGMRVLATRASGADARLSFAGLIDLLDGVTGPELSGLPRPQRSALEVALLRAEPEATAPSWGAIALGFLNAVRALAARGPLLVAVDDVQWLDSPSADALAYAVRRLEMGSVHLLLARRPGRPSALERALETWPVQRLEVAPLSLGATRRLLFVRLGLSLQRHVLRQVVEATLGNPLFALEVGRALSEQGLPPMGEALPVPATVEELLGSRVVRLSSSVRRLLLAVALSAELGVEQLAELADATAVGEALDRGLLLVDGERVRASHPLLAAAARRRSSSRARRALHRDIARVLRDEELRALHLALSAERPDPILAATVAEAADIASARGARQEAVKLADHALRLTPARSAARSRRVLALAQYLALAGEEHRLTKLLSTALDELPEGGARAHAHLLLTRGTVSHMNEIMRHLERALDEGFADPELHARVLAEKATYMAVCYVERVREAAGWAREAEGVVEALDTSSETEVDLLRALAWTSALRGQPLDDLVERSRALPAGAINLVDSVERVAGVRLGWRGQVEDARALFERLAAVADERGEASSYVVLLQQRCELELRAGEWRATSSLLDEWRQAAERELVAAPSYQRCQALLAAGRGLPDEVEQWVVQAIAGSEASGILWSLLEALRARGICALLTHEPDRALESLHPVWAHTEREGITEPGAFPSAPDLVEGLVEAGELDEASAVADRMRELAEQQEHPWGLATATRCEALVALAAHADEEAATAKLAEAAAAYGELGLRFDHARSLLLLGRAQRRRKKWAAARSALEQAVAAFEETGSPGWAEEASAELARVGARRPAATGELTATEQRVVELAADGLSNKEIAATLFVSGKTVEGHLTHAYAKLGVHSRAQLARLLAQGKELASQ